MEIKDDLIGDWCAEEFSGVRFGDRRIEERFIFTASRLASEPMASINQSCKGWAETQAAYRFFANPKVAPEKILAPHREKTLERMAQHDRVFAIQDTVFFDFNRHKKTRGLGGIGKRPNMKDQVQGLVAHSVFTMSEAGEPLGILHQEMWSRKERELPIEEVPLEERESYKWFKALAATPELAGKQVITLCDREADIYHFMAYALENKSSFLIRSSSDRTLEVKPRKKLSAFAETLPIAGKIEINVESASRKKRTATLEVKYSKIIVRAPVDQQVFSDEKLAPLSLFFVSAREVNPPGGEEAVEWKLFTDLPVESFSDAVQKIKWYKLRWHIESFHKVLKSGCRVEDCRLAEADRLRCYISLFCVVAWRLYWMTLVSRTDGEASCEVILEEHEWKYLHMQWNKNKPLPNKPPSTRQAIRWIAQLGGFLARKCDGEPGMTTLWRGWQKLAIASQAYSLFSRPAISVE
jgi:hypothetical protein